MSYLVLARKWRPRRFAELVGQTHVVRALTNALESGRVHHAFLFTGTRGVGKTTIARIFAKSLNCEQGTSAEPCGECGACRDIDAGRFVDLLEIDAASHTGVDNVRELIDNAQYMPARGRTKVYLIDEVHMLSKQAFNALLKTLEEPPGHVKFLLATTDPDKLPVTVLSRCLQFNLKRLDIGQIEGQIARILEAEQIASDAGSRRLLADAADGSLRDGLSLLDQAIAYGGGALEESAVRDMLGSVDRHRIVALLRALAGNDVEAMLSEVVALAEFSPDFASVLDELASALHRIQLCQLAPSLAESEPDPALAELAGAIEPGLVQLWYRIALDGQIELPLAPSPRAGFEMLLLRMLAFRPVDETQAAAVHVPQAGSARPLPAAGRGSDSEGASAAPDRPRSVERTEVEPAATERADDRPQPAAAMASNRIAEPKPAAVCQSAETFQALADNEDWLRLLERVELRGPPRELAAHTAFVGFSDGVLVLSLSDGLDHLRGDGLVRRLAQALAPLLGQEPTIRFASAASTAVDTLHSRTERVRSDRQQQAERQFLGDSAVQHLIQRYGATVLPDSIQPVEDN